MAADKLPRDDAILVHYALGVIDDRAARYGVAFGHFPAGTGGGQGEEAARCETVFAPANDNPFYSP